MKEYRRNIQFNITHIHTLKHKHIIETRSANRVGNSPQVAHRNTERGRGITFYDIQECMYTHAHTHSAFIHSLLDIINTTKKHKNKEMSSLFMIPEGYIHFLLDIINTTKTHKNKEMSSLFMIPEGYIHSLLAIRLCGDPKKKKEEKEKKRKYKS